jgi:hypothetical protein
VSRLWREVILHTPRAWCFIDFRDLDASCLDTYFERSGQCGLHLALANPYEVELLAPVAHRVQCLAFPFISAPLEPNITFPRLTRLRTPLFPDHQWFSDPAALIPSRFPNLRHLELRNVLLDPPNCQALSSLQTLKITIFDDDGWSELLTSCKESLVSLQITWLASDYDFQVPLIELPNLRYLKVVDGNRKDCSWASPLLTPALRAYWEEAASSSEAEKRRECIGSITHLRLQRVPTMFPTQLRVLQLDVVNEELCCACIQII